MCVNFCKWSWSMKIFVSHMKAHQRSRRAEQKFNNHVDKMMCCIDGNHLLFPDVPFQAWLVHGESGHANWDKVYAWALKHGSLITKINMATAISVSNRWTQIWPYSSGGLTRYLVLAWLHCTTSTIEGALFCSHRYTDWLQMWLCLPCLQCLWQNYNLWTYRLPYLLPSQYYTYHLFQPKKNLISHHIKCGNGLICMKFTGLVR